MLARVMRKCSGGGRVLEGGSGRSSVGSGSPSSSVAAVDASLSSSASTASRKVSVDSGVRIVVKVGVWKRARGERPRTVDEFCESRSQRLQRTSLGEVTHLADLLDHEASLIVLLESQQTSIGLHRACLMPGFLLQSYISLRHPILPCTSDDSSRRPSQWWWPDRLALLSNIVHRRAKVRR